MEGAQVMSNDQWDAVLLLVLNVMRKSESLEDAIQRVKASLIRQKFEDEPEKEIK